MLKLNHTERLDHLKSPENKEIRNKWRSLTWKKSEEIFNLLNTDQEFDTSFERKKAERYFGDQKTRYYTNRDFYITKKKILRLRWVKSQHYETDDFFIEMHELILSLNEAKSNQQTAIPPQILLDSDNMYWKTTGDKFGDKLVLQWYFKLFEDEEPEKTPHETSQTNTTPEIHQTPFPREEESQPSSDISEDSKDTDDYSDWLRQN